MKRVIDLLREGFPLKKQYVLWGIPLGMFLCWAILYPSSIEKALLLLLAVGARLLLASKGYWRAMSKYYRGWWLVGGLIAGIPYDWVVEKSGGGRRSSVGIVCFFTAFLVFHLAATYFRRKWDEEEENGVEKTPMPPKRKAAIIISVSLVVLLLLGFVIEPHILRFPKESSVSWCKTVGDDTRHVLSSEDAAEVVDILNSYWGWGYASCSCFMIKSVTIGEMEVHMNDSYTHCHYDGSGRRMYLDLKEKDTAALKAIFEQS